ncbi:tubulin-specific chaperone cofactor E-like protein isoform X2 [Acanthaster planci]|nr:tubulin-specific chaperone cofactor E-like protein isoform X2 [Acanthaster planci]
MAEIEMLNEELPLGAAGGKSLPEAIKEKYLTEDEPLSGMILGQVNIISNLPAIKDSNSGAINLPPCLALNYCCIVGAGDEGEVERLCKNVVELDLSENSLSEWKEVLSITGQIPKLRFLNLSSNPLSTDIPVQLAPVPPMAGITNLVLNNTQVPWSTVHVLLDGTPRLEQLHLSLNKYGMVDSASKAYHSVKLLQFNRNDITDWTDVTKLGQMFPCLESFYLSENDVRGLTNAVGPHFPSLRSVCLSETGLASWEEIDALAAFPVLAEVRLKRVPLAEAYDEKERHQLMIARLTRRVTRLNGSRIGETEREQAERAFIRYYMNQEDKPARYHELVATYGNLNPLADVDLRPKTHVHCLVRFEDKCQEWDIPVKQTCGQLKQSLQEFAGLPTSKFRVWYLNRAYTEGCGPTLLQYPGRLLYALRIQDGDEFIIDRK